MTLTTPNTTAQPRGHHSERGAANRVHPPDSQKPEPLALRYAFGKKSSRNLMLSLPLQLPALIFPSLRLPIGLIFGPPPLLAPVLPAPAAPVPLRLHLQTWWWSWPRFHRSRPFSPPPLSLKRSKGPAGPLNTSNLSDEARKTLETPLGCPSEGLPGHILSLQLAPT